MIRFNCPWCGEKISIPGKNAGMKGRCPSCKAIVLVPTPDAKLLVKPPESAGPAKPASPTPSPSPAANSLASLAQEDAPEKKNSEFYGNDALDDGGGGGSLLADAIRVDKQAEGKPTAYCRTCQAPLYPGWNTCPSCGVMLQGHRTAPTAAPVPTKRSNVRIVGKPRPVRRPRKQRPADKEPKVGFRGPDLSEIAKPLTISFAVLILIMGLVMFKQAATMAQRHSQDIGVLAYITLATALVQALAVLCRASAGSLGFTRVVCVAWGAGLIANATSRLLVFLYNVMTFEGRIDFSLVRILSAILLALIVIGVLLFKYGMRPKRGGIIEIIMFVITFLLLIPLFFLPTGRQM